jgi:pilus assembly protein CpaB
LALPGDYVDVILTQTFGDNVTDIGRKTVGETVLRDVRVIAIDQSLNPQPNIIEAAPNAVSAEARVPKTVTLELFERQAETLLVAAQLGKFQLAVRPLEAAGAARPEEKRTAKPVWASDVSLAVKGTAQPPRNCDPKVSFTGSTLECSVRRPANLSYYRAPLASTVIAPSNAERGPYE